MNDHKLNLIRTYFLKLKIIARGNDLKVVGEPEVIEQFEKKVSLLVRHIAEFNALNDGQIESLMLKETEDLPFQNFGEIIVHGNGGI